MTVQGKNYSAEHAGPFETVLQRDFMGFHGKYFIVTPSEFVDCVGRLVAI